MHEGDDEWETWEEPKRVVKKTEEVNPLFLKEVWTLRNICILPFVLFIRLPVMYFLRFITWVGVKADEAESWCRFNMPGLERPRK